MTVDDQHKHLGYISRLMTLIGITIKFDYNNVHRINKVKETGKEFNYSVLMIER